jgi:hypothetical protein
MKRLLLTVTRTEVIRNRGLALMPGIVFQPDEEFCAGDPVVLLRPDGSAVIWRIGSLTVRTPSPWHNDVCIVLKHMTKEDVPVGTEVWSVRSQSRPYEPEPPRELPRRVIVRVDHPHAEGMAIAVKFSMKEKNPYYYLAFLGPDGSAVITREELLRDFHEQMSFALMDYVSPEGGFTGGIAAKVPSTRELLDAIKGYKMFRKYVTFPEDYEKNLKAAAAARGQDPEEYKVQLRFE